MDFLPLLRVLFSLLVFLVTLSWAGLTPGGLSDTDQSPSSGFVLEDGRSGHLTFRPRARIFFPDNVPGPRRRRIKGKQSGSVQSKQSPQFQREVNQAPGFDHYQWCQRPSSLWIQSVLSLVEEEMKNPPLLDFPVDESKIVFDDKAHEPPPPNAVPYDWLQNWLKLNLKPTETRLDHKVTQPKYEPNQIKLRTVLEKQTRLIYEQLLEVIKTRLN